MPFAVRVAAPVPPLGTVSGLEKLTVPVAVRLVNVAAAGADPPMIELLIVLVVIATPLIVPPVMATTEILGDAQDGFAPDPPVVKT